MTTKSKSPLYRRIRQILESAQARVARTVNTTQVVANWLIGLEIVEEEQKGRRRAGYGERLLRDLAEAIQKEYGSGYGLTNLKLFKKFYLEYPGLTGIQKGHAVRDFFILGPTPEISGKGHAARDLLSMPAEFSSAQSNKSWQPGVLHANLSWTHYRTLLRVEKPEARAFYEIESLKNNWSARELER